ncbi:zonular occludens toxin domain-containing protein [Thiovibrio sp. JS02]
MAVRIVDGNPGAGKTYWAVHHLLKQYFDYEPDLDRYFLKEQYKEVVIITNIDSLKIPHRSLNTMIDECNKEMGLDDRDLEKYGKGYVFFSHDYQEMLAECINAPVVYVIDESQRFFHKRYYYRPVFEWFELHRHFQQDIFLISQSYKKIAPDILELCEIVVHGVARTRSLTGKEFRYKHISQGDVMKTEVLLKDKKIFALYKSMMGGVEVEKISNPLVKKIALALVGVLALGSFGVYRLLHSFGGDTATASAASSTHESTPAPLYASSASARLKPAKYFVIMGKTYISFDGQLYTEGDFPYKLTRKGRSLYVEL